MIRTLTNITLSGNRATVRGGAIARPKSFRIRNSIVWNNQDSSGIGTESATLSDYFPSDIDSVNYALLQGYSATEFTGSNNLDGRNSANNPLFRNAVNPVSAPTLAGNLRLLQDSPMRDRGNNAFVSGVPTVLDGEARIFDAVVDLGPFEGTDLLFSDGFEDSGFQVSQESYQSLQVEL